MTAERWEEVGRLYDAALELDEARRASFLERACGGDEELRREVASLLASDRRAGSFLAAPAVEVAAKGLGAAGISPFIGRRVQPGAPQGRHAIARGRSASAAPSPQPTRRPSPEGAT